MSSNGVLSAVDRIATDVVSANAAKIDVEATFPKASMDALAQAGLFGLVSAPEVGGKGQSFRAAAEVIDRIAQECGSTAMVLTMHYCGSAVLEKYADIATRKDVAAGRHLSTLAFSEEGSRSMFWAPMSTARKEETNIRLDAKKSWITAAHHATAYVWSSRPVAAEGPSTIWLVPSDATGLDRAPRYDGLGLRGNDSTPVIANGVRIPESNRLGEDGQGFGIMMETVLPMFNVLSSACSVGLMTGAIARMANHAGATKFEHLGSSLAEQPATRQHIARAQIKADLARALLFDTITALETGRPDAMLRVLEVKAAAGDTASEVLGLCMRICGGAAYRRDVAVERYFRDAQAASVMAPTTDTLQDFIGKAVCGLPLF